MLVNFLEMEFFKKFSKNFSIKIFPTVRWESILICRLLVNIFKSELVAFEIKPIRNFEEFLGLNFDFLKKKKKQKFIFINFGADKNLTKFFKNKQIYFENVVIFQDTGFIHVKNFNSKNILIVLAQKKQLNLIKNKKHFHERKKTSSKKKIVDSCFLIFFRFLKKIKKETLESIWFQIITINRFYLFDFIKFSTNQKKINWLEKKLLFFSIKKKNQYFPKKKPGFKTNYLNNFCKIQELPIPLLRDWNLFDALTTNPFFGTKFKIWKKSGIRTISKYFFRLGLTLKETNEAWYYLKQNKKKILESHIESESFFFGINFKKFDSFLKIFFEENFFSEINFYEISACDYFLSIESLSDCKIFEIFKKNNLKIFWNAYYSLENFKNIKKGIKITQKIQKFVSKMSRIIICNKVYISEDQVNYIHIKNKKNLNITYLMVKNLVLYLMLAFSSKKKEKIIVIILTFQIKTIIVGCFPKLKFLKNLKKKQKIKESLVKLGAFFDDQNTFFLEIESSSEKNFYERFNKKCQ